MNNNIEVQVNKQEELQAKAKQYIETKQYDKVFILNDILKDLEMNPNVFMEGELNRLS